MKQIPAKPVFLVLFCCALSGQASAQTSISASQADTRSSVIRAVMNHLIQNHISPKPVNDSFSVGVFRDIIQQLDPQRHTFMQPDINRLKAQQYQIDEQLMSGSTAFFDSVISIYRTRMTEFRQLYSGILEKPLDLEKNEIFPASHTPPASKEERTMMLTRKLKMDVLKRYSVLAGNQTKLDPALEAKARASVLKMYDGYFSRELSEKATKEKFTAYVNVVAFQMDPHTSYTAPDYAETFAGIDGKPYYGLGLQLDNSGTDIIIRHIVSGSTADKSGQFKVNDRILSIADKNGNMVPVTGMQAREVPALLSSTSPATATLRIEHEDATEQTVVVPREEMIMLEYKPRSAVLINDGIRYGYIKLPMFYGGVFVGADMNAGALTEKEIEKLLAQEVKAVILDLRGNPGGAVDVAQYIGGLFGLKNVMSITVAKFNSTFERPGSNILYKGALILLTDESTASASEMLAGAVQDEGRAIVMGAASTYGKGTGQIPGSLFQKDTVSGKTNIGLGNFNVTIKKIYRGDGTSNQVRGVIPDIIFLEKTKLASVRERDFSTALPGGFYENADYKKGTWNFDYPRVVKNAQERIRNNQSINLIAGNFAKLEKLLSQPVEMNWKKYADRNKEYRQLEIDIANAALSVDSKLLQAETSMPEWMNPNNIHPYQLLEYQDWLKTLGKDIYLLEAVQVAKDMIANPG
ncbi:MAG: carboxy terminal-processing peptidase [Pseudobacter sp.]|uniref:carboxy terminal-processing peptidase n=1 Tax=Pseudobacter sp. TaxID=2045420 RepID=UPI003F81983E